MDETTRDIAPRFRKRRRRIFGIRMKKPDAKVSLGLGTMTPGIEGIVGQAVREQCEREAEALVGEMDLAERAGEGHSREGGPEMLRAWFGLGLLGKKTGQSGRSGVYTGYKGRSYRLTKTGERRYRITRLKP